MEKRPIANTGLEVTTLCIGTSSLGNMPDTYGYEVSEERAHATVRAIFTWASRPSSPNCGGL